MKKDNYKMKFANFITSRIIIPMFIFLDIIFCIIFYFEDKTSFFENSLIATITIAIMSLLTYFALIIVGNILSKNQNFRQDDLYFYQDNRKILKTDLLRIDIVVAKAELCPLTQIEHLFYWPGNDCLSASIKSVLQDMKPIGKPIYSYFVRIL